MGAVLNRSAALTELLLGAGAAAGVLVPPGVHLAMVRVRVCGCGCGPVKGVKGRGVRVQGKGKGVYVVGEVGAVRVPGTCVGVGWLGLDPPSCNG